MNKTPRPSPTTPTTAAESQLLSVLRIIDAQKRKVCADPRPPYTYRSVEEWLLTNGRFWTPAPLPETVTTMAPRACYDNAYQLAVRSSSWFRYVEGRAVGASDSDCPHAWCTNNEDQVVDPTWGDSGAAYFGAVFALDAVGRLHAETGGGSMLYGLERGQLLLQDPRGQSVSEGPS